MDKIEKIRQEIERQLNILTNVYAEQVERKDEEMMNYYHGKVIALDDIWQFLDTLSEEPDESLEEAAEIIAKNILGRDYLAELDEDCAIDALEDAKNFVKAGAEWKESQMLKDAVEGYVNYYEDSGGKLMAEAQVGCPYHVGDKVRIVVLKEEEE